MGNQPRQRQFQHTLEFYLESQHPIHGTVNVYTTKLQPMAFIMRLDRTTEQSRLYNLFQQIQDHECNSLLTLFGFSISRNEACAVCSSGDSTIEYWEFLNYNFQEHLLERAKRKVKFEYYQYWHVFQTVLESLSMLQQQDLVWDVHPSLLNISPEGKLKSDWSFLQIDNQHLRFQRNLTHHILPDDPWWSPEELWILKERIRHASINIDSQQTNIYKLGLLLLAMANLTSHPTTNKQQLQNVNKIPQPFASIIHSCLQIDPNLRPTFAQLIKRYQQYFSYDYELLISESQRDDKTEGQQHSIYGNHNSKANFNEFKEVSVYSARQKKQEFHSGQRIGTQSYDQRLQALRQYRKNLLQSRRNTRR